MKTALPEKEGMKLWESRRKDWHKVPGMTNNDRKENWYNLVHCVNAVVSRNRVGDILTVVVYPSI